MTEIKNNTVVVITGSTRGIGLGLARSFLAEGCRVIISGRAQDKVDEVRKTLSQECDADHVKGCACDVGEYGQLQGLLDYCIQYFGQIDIWINNAGLGHNSLPFWEQDVKKIDEILSVNLRGVMYGSRVAIRGMLSQGWGHVYNMEGLGSDGRVILGQTIYGTSKSGLAYLTKALARETRATPLNVSALSPGMVITDLLLGNTDISSDSFKKGKKIFNILADRVETVTPWMVRQILSNSGKGRDIRWLTAGKIFWRFLCAPFSKRDFFDEGSGL
ncbi:MAG: SDR family oxidoreductase [Candidatus Marinimicrobia bacterium]|nr:SDR family oxidoreductase [Candidatus Neomarinimicrobiota bacterium]